MNVYYLNINRLSKRAARALLLKRSKKQAERERTQIKISSKPSRLFKNVTPLVLCFYELKLSQDHSH